MANFLIWLGGRRFIMTMVCGAACFILLWNGKIGEGVFRDLMIATVALYIGGNTYQKIKGTADCNQNQND